MRAFDNRKLPEPWSKKHVAIVGGLFAVGYAEGSDTLLVVSHDGRGVFDALSGERLARESNPPHVSWFSEIPYRAQGIGPLSGRSIQLSGLHGGGLPTVTRDGWSVEVLPIDWPDRIVFLQPPLMSVMIEGRGAGCARIDVTEEMRAAGFSETGQSFVIATSNDISFYVRAEP
ncbi:MAG TPA: hypothetical protein VLV56_09670 [Burkholderiales bacterium]|nr:hypothetical protein [Burkholderiales bacterium]